MDRLSFPFSRFMITHLVSPGAFEEASVQIEGDTYRHFFRARRLAQGERLRLVDGAGRARWGRIENVDRKSATVLCGDPAPTHEPSFRLTLFVAALRPERASWLVEKATELGVTAIRFLASDRTPRKYGSGQLDRLHRVAAAAVMQCHRSLLPEVSGVHPWTDLENLLEKPSNTAECFVLDPSGRESLRWRSDAADVGAVFIGPEGGWSPAETEELQQRGCQKVGLGPRILRVETAAVVATCRML